MFKKIICPDCNKELTKFNIERFQNREYTINYETHELTPDHDSQWSTNDFAFRCPYCDSLNTDYEASKGKFNFKE
jgi:hypothetical protein